MIFLVFIFYSSYIFSSISNNRNDIAKYTNEIRAITETLSKYNDQKRCCIQQIEACKRIFNNETKLVGSACDQLTSLKPHNIANSSFVVNKVVYNVQKMNVSVNKNKNNMMQLENLKNNLKDLERLIDNEVRKKRILEAKLASLN